MMIGMFSKIGDGFAGRLRTLTIDAEISIVPAAMSSAENAPDWRVLLGDSDIGVEIGAGWNRTGARAGAYVSVQLDDPLLAMPVHAALLRSARQPDVHHLLWSRPQTGPRR